MENKKFVFYFALITLLEPTGCKKNEFPNMFNDMMNRKSRSLLFPLSSTHGILVAVAMPIDLSRRNVFFSYNFEANYNLPGQAKELIPGPLERLGLVDEDGRDLKCGLTNDTCTTEPTTKKPRKRKHRKRPKKDNIQDMIDNSLTRKQFYRIVIDKLNFFGYNGKACLLRLICEVNEHSMHEHNGVFGSIMHVLLSPSTSQRENLHSAYYRAELDGREKDCQRYTKRCKHSILQEITKEHELDLDD